MQRLIFGPDSDGLNSVIHRGDLHPVGTRPALRTQPHVDLAWVGATDQAAEGADAAASLTDFDYRLAPGEVRFMRFAIPPGVGSSVHRTPLINDYMVAVSGELTMYAEDGTATRFMAGDMLVQLGGWHSWKNASSEPFVMAGVIIGVMSECDAASGVEVRAADR